MIQSFEWEREWEIITELQDHYTKISMDILKYSYQKDIKLISLFLLSIKLDNDFSGDPQLWQSHSLRPIHCST